LGSKNGWMMFQGRLRRWSERKGKSLKYFRVSIVSILICWFYHVLSFFLVSEFDSPLLCRLHPEVFLLQSDNFDGCIKTPQVRLVINWVNIEVNRENYIPKVAIMSYLLWFGAPLWWFNGPLTVKLSPFCVIPLIMSWSNRGLPIDTVQVLSSKVQTVMTGGHSY
jgi:hypothetical protein